MDRIDGGDQINVNNGRLNITKVQGVSWWLAGIRCAGAMQMSSRKKKKMISTKRDFDG